MNDSWYDTAQICTNGHLINSQSVNSPEHNKKFCDKCGARTITNCQNCNASIRGDYFVAGMGEPSYNTYFRLPSFCPDCGKPYPWTEAKLKAAQDFTDMLEELTQEERDLLKKSLNDIVLDTPQTPVAANRFKMLAAKVGKVAAEQLRELVVDIASETAKKIILEQGKF